MRRLQAEQMHEKSNRKVLTFGKVYRKVSNIERMKTTTQGNNINRKRTAEQVAGTVTLPTSVRPAIWFPSSFTGDACDINVKIRAQARP